MTDDLDASPELLDLLWFTLTGIGLGVPPGHELFTAEPDHAKPTAP